MRILVTGGGTAGHITPILAVVSSLKKRHPESKVFYIGNFGDPMSKDIKKSDEITKVGTILSGKLRRFHGKKWYWYFSQPALVIRNLRDLIYLFIGTLQSLVFIIKWNPDVIFVKGGYVGLPVGIAAGLLRKPLVTHDSDVIPGLTNKILSRFATLQAVGMPIVNYSYPKNKLRYTGTPVQKKFTNPETNQDLGFMHEDRPLVVVVGGSLGAIRLNNCLLNDINTILDNSSANLYWLCGDSQYEEIDSLLSDIAKNRVILKPFSSDLNIILAKASVVVSRAGATTMAELAILGKPTILVPNPLLTGGHQTKNSLVYQDANACIVITEDQLANDSQVLGQSIIELLNNPKLTQQLATNIKQFAVTNAADNIVDVLLEVLEQPKR